MKKLLSLALILVLLLGISGPAYASEEADPASSATRTIILKIGSPVMSIDGVENPIDSQGTAPILKDGSTLVPLRAIFEALFAEVIWTPETQGITGIRGNTRIELAIGQNTAYKNGSAVHLAVPPALIDGRTMVPLRFIAESLGADVHWEPEKSVITITLTEIYLSVKDTSIFIGDSVEALTDMLGQADRIDPSSYDFEWHVYNSDYSRFIMAGVKNGIVEALYSNSAGFETNGAKYGELAPESTRNIRFYTDKHNDSKIYAVLILSDNIKSVEYGPDYYRAQELENFDAVNAFRVSNGFSVLLWDEVAAKTAREHSQDMADKNYFNHTNLEGLSPWDRYKNNNGPHFGSGENITAGSMLGVSALDSFVNSEGHRNNMLGGHKYLGVGFAYNSSSTYKYYLTQFFSS